MLPSPRELISLVHRRIHSPSIPDLWVPSSRIPNSEPAVGPIHSVQPPPVVRPSLGSLDLASPPTKSALPLTPPLTPASTRPADSDSSDECSSRSNSFDVAQLDPYAHESQLSQWSPSEAAFQMHKTPVPDANQFYNIALPDSVLPSPTSPTHPKHSPGQRVTDFDLEDSQHPSRFLFISGIPNTASSHTLKQAFVGCGDLKGIFVRYQAEHGVIILAFFDVRHTLRAHRQVATRTFFAGTRLASRFISPNELRNLIGQSNFVNQNEGDLLVTTTFLGSEGELDAAALQNVLASFGDLRSFSAADSSVRAFQVGYFDARDASSALNALHGRVILGVRLHLTLRDASADVMSEVHVLPGININVNLGSVGTVTSASDEQIPFPHVESPESPTPTNSVGLPFPSVSKHASAEFFDRPGPERPGPSQGHGPAILERRLSVDSLLHELRASGLHHSVSEQNLRMRAKVDAPHPLPEAHIPHLSTQVQSQHADASLGVDAHVSGTDPAHVQAYTNLDDDADAKTPTAGRPSRVKTPPQYIHARRISNIYHFDSVGKVPIPRTAPRPRSISVASDTASPIVGRGLVLEDGVGADVSAASPGGGGGGGGHGGETESLAGKVAALEGSRAVGSPGGTRMGLGLGVEGSPVMGRVVALPPYQGPLPVPVVNAGEEDAHWPRERSGSDSEVYSAEHYYMATAVAAQQQQQQQIYQSPQTHHQVRQSTTQNQTSVPTRRQLGLGGVTPRRGHAAQGHVHGHGHGTLSLEMTGERERERDAPPERNRIDIGKIERGEETRTTVMIKNIPNKMSDRHLIDFINDVCPRTIDFLYLRMDFTNGCNVGYAFVNFIQVEDLLHFAKTKLGTKWNLFSSEKVLGMSYANYQGKEALIDKFRSSSIMDQREAWRPKLFHSYGPRQGLPEDFPAPTHMRRKERSSLLPNELHQNRAMFHHPSGMRG